MTVDLDQLRDDLKGEFEGDLLLDELACALYSTDASPFTIQPQAVLRPRHEADVQAIVRYAAENSIPLTARGGGTGTAGAALGPGLVLDFTRYMHSVIDIGTDSVRAQAGATWDDLQRRLSTVGRRLAVEPAGATLATIGGLIATDAAGPRIARFGYPHEHLLACRGVLDNGDALEFGLVTRKVDDVQPERFRRLHRATIELLERHAPTISDERRSTPFDRCGYRLDALTAQGLDYSRLLAGSEGTLALFTEVTVRTLPLPEGRSAAIFGFDDLGSGLEAALVCRSHEPSACVLLDRRLVSLVQARNDPSARMLPSQVGAALVVEFEADTQSDAGQAVLDLIDDLTQKRGLARLAVPGLTADDAARLWMFVDAALPSLVDLRGGPPASFGIEDVGVPPERLPEFLTRLQEVLQRREATAAFMVHASIGHVHVRPFVDLADPADAARLWAIAEDVYSAALDLGGTISVRHGTGLARTPWVAKQYPRLTPVFRELKTIFDPRHLFNPGNIVGPDPSRPAWPMRPSLPVSGLTPLLVWSPDQIASEIAACNGCGSCRAADVPERMCPVFRASRSEDATPRAKANLMRELLRSGAEPRRFSPAAVRQVADLCVNCKMCARECPAHVNIPKLMLEAKAAHVAEHGLDRADWVMARLAVFSWFGSSFSLVANRLLRGPIMRWFMEKFFGISRRRRLPPFAIRSFLRQAKRWGWTRRRSPNSLAGNERSRDRVALFVDIFANYHDPTIAEAAVRVLQHNEVEVFVPPHQASCGMEALAQGDVDTARDLARQNLRVFANLVREGYTVVCPEPTSALFLTKDILDLLDDPDARLLAANTVELTAYLADRQQRQGLKSDFRTLSLSLGHHVPCHLKALGRTPAAPAILRHVPGIRVYEIDVGCSGMAGTFGLGAGQYETSLAAGRALFQELDRPRIQFGVTECSSCRLQMEEGAGKRTLHPVQYLAMAYGLMPDLAQRLLRPVGGLVAQ